ncbi:hypothetical protein J6590_071356 [Homalodisca vitripennis]|nr:hypothetical protein J6590_071356 [Homalodisca vitripennis]
MCEIVEKRRNVPYTQIYQQFMLRIWRRVKLRSQLSSAIYKLYSLIISAAIMILEFVTMALRGMLGQEIVRTVDREAQTYMCYQDLTELVTHHFGSLHEEHSISKIIHKIQWNQLNTEISWLKENLQRRDGREDVLVSLKEDVEILKRTVQELSSKMDGNFKCPTFSNIPPPPPLPPAGFFLTSTDLQNTNMSQRERRIFGENVPPRPIITVESLRQVKLKKTTMSLKQENKDLTNFKPNTKSSPIFVRKKRPKTTDSLKTTEKNDFINSSPRPISSNI